MTLFAPRRTDSEVLADQLLTRASSDFARMLHDHRETFNLLWKSPDPAAVLAAMGTDAKKAMLLAWARVQFILSIDPTALQPSEYNPPHALVMHDDGTVTIQS